MLRWSSNNTPQNSNQSRKSGKKTSTFTGSEKASGAVLDKKAEQAGTSWDVEKGAASFQHPEKQEHLQKESGESNEGALQREVQELRKEVERLRAAAIQPAQGESSGSVVDPQEGKLNDQD